MLINMLKKYKLVAILVAINLVISIYLIKIIRENNIRSKLVDLQELHGTFITRNNTLSDAQYLVIDKIDNYVYYYNQSSFKYKNKYNKDIINGIYSFKINNDNFTIFVRDNDNIILVKDDISINFVRISNYLEFIGNNINNR